MVTTVFLFSCGLEHGFLCGDTEVLVVHCLLDILENQKKVVSCKLVKRG